jgi:nitrite reductase/ring-hydroxylating ferredoxin subunit
MTSPLAVAKIDEIETGKSVVVTFHKESVAIFNVDGTLFACTNRCPHAGAPLQNGMLNGTVLTCPWHGWRFDLAAGPGAPKDGVLRYPVTVENGDVFLHLPEPE